MFWFGLKQTQEHKQLAKACLYSIDRGQIFGRMRKEFESIQTSIIEGTGLFSNSKYEFIVATFNSDEGSQLGHDGQKNSPGKPNGLTLTYMPDDKFKITNCKYGEEIKVLC